MHSSRDSSPPPMSNTARICPPWTISFICSASRYSRRFDFANAICVENSIAIEIDGALERDRGRAAEVCRVFAMRRPGFHDCTRAGFLPWLDHPGVFVCRFETMSGDHGVDEQGRVLRGIADIVDWGSVGDPLQLFLSRVHRQSTRTFSGSRSSRDRYFSPGRRRYAPNAASAS